jgi:hypothetical protein
MTKPAGCRHIPRAYADQWFTGGVAADLFARKSVCPRLFTCDIARDVWGDENVRGMPQRMIVRKWLRVSHVERCADVT